MKLHNLVLSKDLNLAKNLKSCINLCSNEMNKSLETHDYEKAVWWSVEIKRCKRDLEQLIRKKSQIINRRKLEKILQRRERNAQIGDF